MRALFLFVLFLAAICFADGLIPSKVSAGGSVTRDRQLQEIEKVLRGGRGGYIGLGTYFLPTPHQLPLSTEYGEHDGFAFRQRFAGFGAGEISKNLHMGALLWFDRSGWDTEDFIVFPEYGKFSLLRSNVTWGLTLTDSKTDWTVALGMQHQNVENVGRPYEHENDSLLYSWAHLRFWRMSAQAVLYRNELNMLRLSMNLESRNVFGGAKSGPQTYLPNVSVTFYGNDFDTARVTWEQNLYGQKLYSETSFDVPTVGFREFALKFYPDPSRMIGFEATCVRRNQSKGHSDLLWGGAIDLLFVRLAYNSAYDYKNLFGAKGTFVAEIKFNLETIDGMLFNLGASRSSPIETNIIKRADEFRNSSPKTIDDAPKTLEAKGVRYEKANVITETPNETGGVK